MEQPYYLLLGAGVFIMIAALFLKKGNGSSAIAAPQTAPKQVERGEMEKALQRFVHQVKDENDRLASEVRHTRQEFQQLISAVEERLQKAETMIKQLSIIADSAQTNPTNDQEGPEEKTENEDMLALHERYSRVFELQEEGLAVDEIAKRLGAGCGEIELILSLAGPSDRGAKNEA